jgi:outer membrane protein OmpA-like peptidoglycan-associated protein
MTGGRWLRRGASAVALALLATSCSTAATLRGRVDGLTDVVAKAERNGAMRCAPRELALAKSHLRFAAIELEQGSLSGAESHLVVAEPNAKAAYDLSPEDKCSDRPQPKVGDRDGDGIPDSVDKCPDIRETYNGFEDEDGCPDDPDTDGDGIPDSRDACMFEPEDKDNYLDEDGCPEPDNDLDGIPDKLDKCPNEPEDPDGFEDEDGCPDKDNDKDTVLDVDDQCPNTPGPPGGPRPGCPSLVVVTAKEIRITQQIQFEFNKSVIRPVSYPILDAVKEVLVAYPNITLEVQGHTDNVGTPQYNLRLSDQRADSVKKYLIKAGIDPKRLTSKGYGLTQPLVPNNTEKNRELNRRVQFIRTEAPKP